MRILIVLHKMKKKGGMVLQHLKMSKQFEKNGCEVLVFSFDDYFRTRNVFFNYLIVYKNLHKTIRLFNPEIILTSDPYFSTLFSLVAKKKSTPLVLRIGAIFHPFYAARIIERISPGKIYVRFFYFINFLFKQLDKLILKKCNLVIFNSNFLRKYYRNSSSSSVVIYNGVDKITSKKPRNNNLLNLVYIGRIEPRKSIEIILNSLVILKKRNVKFHFSLIGNTTLYAEYWMKLENLIKSNNLLENITIYGKIPNRDTLAILEKNDILLFSTDERNFPMTEGLPNAILEGMAAGLAIISTSIAGVPEIIDEKNGKLVKSSPLDFAKSIAYFEKNKEQLLEIKNKNIILIKEKYNIENTSKQYLKSFEELIKNKGKKEI